MPKQPSTLSLQIERETAPAAREIVTREALITTSQGLRWHLVSPCSSSFAQVSLPQHLRRDSQANPHYAPLRMTSPSISIVYACQHFEEASVWTSYVGTCKREWGCRQEPHESLGSGRVVTLAPPRPDMPQQPPRPTIPLKHPRTLYPLPHRKRFASAAPRDEQVEQVRST